MNHWTTWQSSTRNAMVGSPAARFGIGLLGPPGSLLGWGGGLAGTVTIAESRRLDWNRERSATSGDLAVMPLTGEGDIASATLRA